MAKAFTHTGLHQAIPPTASPGLRFLKAFILAADSASPLSPFLTPNAVFITNGGEPTPAETIIGMMRMRSQRLRTFRHDVKSAWDIETGNGRRMLLYESVSVTIFKDDPDEKAIEVTEFSTVELEPVDGGEGGFEGLAASVLKTFMDPNPVISRMKQISEPV